MGKRNETLSWSVFMPRIQNKQAIYHTNVLLTIADSFAIICSASIRMKAKNNLLYNHCIKIRRNTWYKFRSDESFLWKLSCMRNNSEWAFLIMSSNAYHHFTTGAKTTMRKPVHCYIAILKQLKHWVVVERAACLQNFSDILPTLVDML